MKKVLVILISLSVLFALAACGENKDVAPPSGTTETGNSSSTEMTTSTESNPDATDPAHTHEYVDKTIAPTCTEDGYTAHTCACGSTYSDSKVVAIGHNFGEWQTIKEPTATTTGSAERKCSNCDEKETKVLGQLIENHKHSYTSKITTPSTCTAVGVKTFSCSCGDTYTETISKASHKYSDSVTNPTCTNGGYTTHTCSVCGDSFSDSNTKPSGHNWKEATCTAPKTCSKCNSTEGNATGHSWNAATCTAPKTCSKCNLTEGSATGHNWKDATCTAPKTCSKCNSTEGNATGHSWDAATCTEPKTCKKCGATEGSEKGHALTTEYNSNTDSIVSKCANCSYSKSEAVKPLKLSFVKIHSHYYDYHRFLSFNFTSDGGYGELTYTFILYNNDMSKIISQCSNETGKGDVTPHGSFKDTKLKVIVRDKYGHSDENVYDTQSLDINWWYMAALSVAKYEAKSSSVTPNWYYHTILENRYNSNIIDYVNRNFTIDWKSQAKIYAQYCLDRQSYTKDELIKKLTDNGFTQEQAVYGVEANGL